jgi:hypothetical protein
MHLPSLIAATLAIFLHFTTAYPGILEVVCDAIDAIGKAIPDIPKCELPGDHENFRNVTETFGDHPDSVSSYPDGSGTFVRLADFHEWDNGDKCWTDLYYVSSSPNRTEWERQGQNDCAGNAAKCHAGIGSGVETCNEWTLGVSASLEGAIFKEILKASGSVTFTESSKKCEQFKTEFKCEWDDKQCHAIWSRISFRTDYGYIRRRCNFEGAGNKTVWSQDWLITEKGHDLELGCNASCNATMYPDL